MNQTNQINQPQSSYSPTKTTLLKHQAEFLQAKDKFVLLLGGIGSGKTACGSWFVINESILNPEIPGLITANTYRQLHNSTLTAVFRECDRLGYDHSYNSQRGILNIEGAKWYIYSLDNYDNMRGIEVGRFWGDELRDASAEAFQVMMGRLRYGSDLKGRVTTSPNGFDYLYDYFAGDKKTPEFRMIKATSYQNKFLPDGYLDSLKSSFDDRVFRQEVLGEFINITQGRIYYGFNRGVHISNEVKLNPKYPVWIGMDFNVNPMTAVVCQNYDDKVYVIDEFFMMTSNTKEMGETIRLKYGLCQVVPDSTGKAMKTAGVGLSDHQILRNLGYDVKSTQNPFRMDRYNCVNNLFEKNKVVISNKCVKLIRDLEQVSYKDGSTYPDEKDSQLTHISDAFGYLCYYWYPMIKVSATATMIPR